MVKKDIIDFIVLDIIAPFLLLVFVVACINMLAMQYEVGEGLLYNKPEEFYLNSDDLEIVYEREEYNLSENFIEIYRVYEDKPSAIITVSSMDFYGTYNFTNVSLSRLSCELVDLDEEYFVYQCDLRSEDDK